MGKTLTLIALLIWLARNAPARALVVLPDQAAAVEFRDRLYADAEASGLQIPPVSKRNLRHVDLDGMRCYLAWSGSKQRVRGRRCKYVFMSEVDVYRYLGEQGDPVISAAQRVKAFPTYLIYAESSPWPEVSRIEQLYQESNRQHWWTRCPVCGTWQDVKFFTGKDGRGGVGGIRDENGNYLEPETARRTAHYLCVQGCVLGEDRKGEFMRSGQWVPRGCSVDRHGRLTGTAESGPRHIGFRLWSALSNATWGEISAEYLLHRANGLVPEWFQNWYGRSYKSKTTMGTWEEVGRRLSLPSYRRGQVPAEAWFLTGMADVQQSEIYYVVRAWGNRCTSWLVDWFVFQRSGGDEQDLVKSDFLQLTEARQMQFPVLGVNPRKRASLSVALLGCDAKYRTADVHQWLVSLGKPTNVRAIQGDGQMRPGERYKMNVVKESKRERDDGTGPVVYEGGLELWSINSPVYRLDVAERFSSDLAKPGAWLLPGDVLQTGQHYLKQLVNEPPTWERGKDGRQRLVFKERDRTLGHDFWDCEVDNRALAQMVVDQMRGSPGWDASKWDRGETPQRPAARAAPADLSHR